MATYAAHGLLLLAQQGGGATDATVTPGLLSTTVTLSAPVVSLSDTVEALLLELTASLPAPTVTTATDVTATPSQLAATITLTTTAVTVDDTVAAEAVAATFTLPTATITVTQIARPDADVSAGGWTNELGSATDLYASINEAQPNHTTYIQSSLSPQDDVSEVSLGALTDPGTNTPFRVPYYYGKNASGGEQVDLTVALVQGTTVIASKTHTDAGVYPIFDTLTLSEAEGASISDFTDLRLRFTADVP